VIWLTWRQHRMPGAVAALAVAVLSGALVLVTLRAGAIADTIGAPFQSDAVRAQIQSEFGPILALAAVGVLLLPVLIGIFAGVPLVSRELEDRTHRMVWTQSLSRDRWFVSKTGLLAGAIVVAAALVSVAATTGSLALPAFAPLAGRWVTFDADLPVLAAWALLAFSAGVLFGALIKRSLPALLATMLLYAAARIVVTAGLRSQYLPPVQATNDRQIPADAWVFPQRFVDNVGREVDTARVSALMRNFGGRVQEFQGDTARYLEANGVFHPIFYQPADRYWTFQGIEAGIVLGASLACVVVALLVVRRLPA
jgi:hypothetical protein